GDEVAYPVRSVSRSSPEFEHETYFVTSNGRTFLHQVASQTFQIDSDWARLFGYYVAEGSAKRGGSLVQFAFNARETSFVEDIQKISGISGSIAVKSNAMRLQLSGKWLNQLLDQFGHRSHTKKIPRWLMVAPAKLQSEFVKGYFRGDGTVHPDSFRASTVSQRLAYQMRDMLLRLGVISQVYKRLPRGIGKHATYEIRIAGQSLLEMSRILQTQHPFTISRVASYRRARLYQNWRGVKKRPGALANFAWFPITAIVTRHYSGLVYNLSVPRIETYALTLGMTVHNCTVDGNREK